MTAAFTSFVESGLAAAGTSTLASPPPMEGAADAAASKVPFSKLVDQALSSGDPRSAPAPDPETADGDVSHSLLPNSRRPLPAPTVAESAVSPETPTPTPIEASPKPAPPSAGAPGSPTCDVIVETDPPIAEAGVPGSEDSAAAEGAPQEPGSEASEKPKTRSPQSSSLKGRSPGTPASPGHGQPAGRAATPVLPVVSLVDSSAGVPSSNVVQGDELSGATEVASEESADDTDVVVVPGDNRTPTSEVVLGVAPAVTEAPMVPPVAMSTPVDPVPATSSGEAAVRPRAGSETAQASGGSPGNAETRTPAVASGQEPPSAPRPIVGVDGGRKPSPDRGMAPELPGQRSPTASDSVSRGTAHRSMPIRGGGAGLEQPAMVEPNVVAPDSSVATPTAVEPMVLAATGSSVGVEEQGVVPTFETDVVIPGVDRPIREEVAKAGPEVRRESPAIGTPERVDRSGTLPTSRAVTSAGGVLVDGAVRHSPTAPDRIVVEASAAPARPVAAASPISGSLTTSRSPSPAEVARGGGSGVAWSQQAPGASEPLRIAQAGFLRFQVAPVEAKTAERLAAPTGVSPQGASAIMVDGTALATSADAAGATRAGVLEQAETSVSSNSVVGQESRAAGSITPRVQAGPTLDTTGGGSGRSEGWVSEGGRESAANLVAARPSEAPVNETAPVETRPASRGEASWLAESRPSVIAVGNDEPVASVPAIAAGTVMEPKDTLTPSAVVGAAGTAVNPNATPVDESLAAADVVEGGLAIGTNALDALNPAGAMARGEVRKDGRMATVQSLSDDAKRTSGTPIAEMGSGMKKGRKPSKAAEETLHILPIDREGLAGASLPTLSSRETSTRRASDWNRSSEAEDVRMATSVPAHPRWEPAQDFEASSDLRLRDYSSRATQVESLIAREAGVVRKTGAQSLSVVLRPDSKTELLVQLNQSANGVEASIRCERGEFPAARAEWNQLRDALAAQNIRLAPPPEMVVAAVAADTATGNGSRSAWAEDRFSRGQQQQQQQQQQQPAPQQQQSHQNNQQQQTSSHRRQEPGYEIRPRSGSEAGVAAKTGPGPQRPVRRGGWESWA